MDEIWRGPTLAADDLIRVHELEVARVSAAPGGARFPGYSLEAGPAPDSLLLKGISLGPRQPLAVINDRTFEINEEGKVRLGKTNVTIRCLAIRADTVRVLVVGSGEVKELRLPKR